MSDNTPTFSLAYTTVRPGAVETVFNMWTSRSKLHNHEWCIAVDSGSEAIESVKNLIAKHPESQIKLVINTKRKNCVDGWNAAAEATTGKVIIAVSDDFVPPEGWDSELLQLHPANSIHWIDGEYVVHVNDGFVQKICTIPIITRARYERFGFLYYPEYESMFADTELTTVAYRDGVVIDATHLLFEHCHHANGKRRKDSADANHENSVRWKRGEMLYEFRKQHGFPLDAGPKACVSTPLTKTTARNYVAYLQVNKDDFCLLEVCNRLIEEGIHTFYFSVPNAYWDDRPTTKEDLESVASVVSKLRLIESVKVNIKIFNVQMYKFPGDSRIDVETRLRNDALAWVRADGHSDILIVDGDELWLPGTLAVIDGIVAQGHLAVSTAMVPVIGLPGWPVDKATDAAVVYIGGACQFKACRTPMAVQAVINRPHIIHFTGTRRTMDEIIAKHRTSGHYDDPAYDFETWIRDVLPNIRPGYAHQWPNGTVGVHMHVPWNPWPAIRNWRPEELNAIPQSLHAFLGSQA